MPCHIQRHSGRIIAEPAIAASTCSQRPCRRATAAICSIGSSAVEVVVPVVATTAQGLRPAAQIARDRLFQRIRPHARSRRRAATRRTLSRPNPASSAAFSTELWLCADV